MRKILVLNECFSDNIGDQAIGLAMKKYCQDLGPVSVSLADFSFRHDLQSTILCNPDKNRRLLPSVVRKTLLLFKSLFLAVRHATKSYDVVFIGGGQLVLSNNSFGLSMFSYVTIFKLFRVNVILFSIGAGTNFPLFDFILFKISLALADKIFVRDVDSVDRLKKIFGVRANLCPDIVYYLSDNIGTKCSNRHALICPVDYPVYLRYMPETDNPYLSYNEYKELWVKNIKEHIAKYNSCKVILTATTAKDLTFARTLYRDLSIDQINIGYTPINSVNEFIEIAKNCNSILSGRMHALILCHCLDLAVSPFPISKKLTVFSREYLGRPPSHHKYILNSIQSSL